MRFQERKDDEDCVMNGIQLQGMTIFCASIAASFVIRRLGYRVMQKKFINNSSRIICEIENRVQRDEGQRGIASFVLKGELESAANAIVDPSTERVAIITGFPCLLDYNPPTETDGPPGALAIARSILAIGKSVVLVTDECNEEVLLAGAAGSQLSQLYGIKFSLESFPGQLSFGTEDDYRLHQLANSVDMVIAIERAGPCHDGSYRTMRKLDMTHLLAPLEDMILYRKTDPSASNKPFRSIGIGDGGNEVGMGKVFDKVLESDVPHAADIACIVPTDHLIVSSVSNWGGYALAAAVAIKQCELVKELDCNSKLKDLLEKCLPSNTVETEICERMRSAGARDGMTKTNELFVDGMPLQVSLDLLDELKYIVTGTME